MFVSVAYLINDVRFADPEHSGHKRLFGGHARWAGIQSDRPGVGVQGGRHPHPAAASRTVPL